MNQDTDAYRSRMQDQSRAADYATRFEKGARRGIDQREQRAVRKIFASLPECRTVLDVPCGAGRFLANLAEGGREVTEADVAPEIVELARQRAASLKLTANFLVADALHLPLGDKSVDVIFCNRLLHHITNAPDRAGFLREFHRVCRTHVVISFFDYRRFGGLRLFLKKLKGRKSNYDGQPTQDEFLREVEQCGFRVKAIIPTGPIWVAQKYLILEKA